ncbi:degenerin-like protein unc-105 [Tachypleus tridentatus]|uniref:degenerin-like protein unc-105 n=1 Tax=Tachypleus tridentatus TaxID=6853 RepID=UPI003FD44940
MGIISGSPQPTCVMKLKILLKRLLGQEVLGKLIFVGSLIGFIFQSFQFLQLFMEYQTTMDISIEPRSGVIFPAVTVCSFEMFRNSYDEIWKALRREYMEDINMTFLKKSGFQLEDMIPNIDPYYMFNRVTSYFDPVYGNCYSFNTAWSGAEIRKAFVKHIESLHHSPTLKSNSLNLLIYLPIKDFSESPTALITFHPPDVAPNVHNYANRWILKPGRLQQYFFTQKTSLMLEPPYQTNCTDYDKIGTTPARPGLLEENLCEMECLENVTLDACGTVCSLVSPFTMESNAKTEKNTLARIGDIGCASEFIEKNQIIHYCEGFCRQPCRKVTYTIEEESRVWPLPNENYKFTYIMDFWVRLANKSSNWTLTKDFVSEQVLLVSIEPSKSESLIYKYYPTFQNIEIFSYFGGYLGMWIGYSVLSMTTILVNLPSIVTDKYLERRGKVQTEESLGQEKPVSCDTTVTVISVD